MSAVDLIDSLRLAADCVRDVEKLRQNAPLVESDGDNRTVRNEIPVSDGVCDIIWKVDSLRSLFRENRQPPPESEMADYPEEYVMSFRGVERNVRLCCYGMFGSE